MGTSTKNKQITFDDIIQVTSDYFKIKKKNFYKKTYSKYCLSKTDSNVSVPKWLIFLIPELVSFLEDAITLLLSMHMKIVKKIKEDPNCEKLLLTL